MEKSIPRQDTGQPVQPLVVHFGSRSPLRLQFLRFRNQTDDRPIAFHPEILPDAGQRQELAILPLYMKIEGYGHLFLGDHAYRHAETVKMTVGNRDRKIGARRNQRLVFLHRIAAESGVRRREIGRRKRALRRRRQYDNTAVESLAPGQYDLVDAPRFDDHFFLLHRQQLIRHFPKQCRPVRLINEARSSQRQPPVVHILFRRGGEHDDGNFPHARREPHAEQQFHAVHARHQYVQEHQRRVGISLQKRERFYAVRRFINFRAVAQHLTEQRPARLIIVHDENLFIRVVHVSTSSRRTPPATKTAVNRQKNAPSINDKWLFDMTRLKSFRLLKIPFPYFSGNFDCFFALNNL